MILVANFEWLEEHIDQLYSKKLFKIMLQVNIFSHGICRKLSAEQERPCHPGITTACVWLFGIITVVSCSCLFILTGGVLETITHLWMILYSTDLERNGLMDDLCKIWITSRPSNTLPASTDTARRCRMVKCSLRRTRKPRKSCSCVIWFCERPLSRAIHLRNGNRKWLWGPSPLKISCNFCKEICHMLKKKLDNNFSVYSWQKKIY